jgi:hypothetical protein
MAKGVVWWSDHRSAIVLIRRAMEDNPAALPKLIQLAEQVDVLNRVHGVRFRADLVKMVEEVEPTLARHRGAGRIPEGEAPFFTQVKDTPRPRVQVQPPFPEKPEAPTPRISLQPPFPEKPEPPAVGTSLADSTWPKSRLTAEFRDTIADLEKSKDYQAFNPAGGGVGALGRYQIRKNHW